MPRLKESTTRLNIEIGTIGDTSRILRISREGIDTERITTGKEKPLRRRLPSIEI